MLSRSKPHTIRNVSFAVVQIPKTIEKSNWHTHLWDGSGESLPCQLRTILDRAVLPRFRFCPGCRTPMVLPLRNLRHRDQAHDQRPLGDLFSDPFQDIAGLTFKDAEGRRIAKSVNDCYQSR